MIVVCGIGRTGTSVIMECLIKSGFNSRDHKLFPLLDLEDEEIRQQILENRIWGLTNSEISVERGVIRSFKFHPQAIGTIMGLRKDNPISNETYSLMSKVIHYFETSNIDILKDPTGIYAYKRWIEYFDIFNDAKWIWTRRDSLTRAKSMVRHRIELYGAKIFRGFTTKKNLEVGRRYERELEQVLPTVNYIEIWLEDLLNKTKEMGDKLSEFIGRQIDMSPVNKKKVWAGKNAGL